MQSILENVAYYLDSVDIKSSIRNRSNRANYYSYHCFLSGCIIMLNSYFYPEIIAINSMIFINL